MVTGCSTTKDTWDPDFLQALASKDKVAEFKGAGHGLQYMYPYDYAYAITDFPSSK